MAYKMTPFLPRSEIPRPPRCRCADSLVLHPFHTWATFTGFACGAHVACLHASSPLPFVVSKITISREFFFFFFFDFFFLILQKHYHKNLQFNFQGKIAPNFFLFFLVGFFVFLCRILVTEKLLACRQVVAGSELKHGGRHHGNYCSDDELQC